MFHWGKKLDTLSHQDNTYQMGKNGNLSPNEYHTEVDMFLLDNIQEKHFRADSNHLGDNSKPMFQ
jgi:hypothetical protein